MRILSPTVLQKKKLKEMILKLFPQYQYVKFGPCGLIFLSKSFWHFYFVKKETIHITELCSVHIPERLQELYVKTFEDNEVIPYQRVFNQYSQMVLHMLHYRTNKVIDYLYDEYVHIKYGLHRNYYVKNNILPEQTYTLSEILKDPVKKDGIVLSNFSTVQVKKTLKHWKDALFVLNHPKLRQNYLNMWFRKEIKEKLNEIYNYRIRIAIS